MNILVNIGVLMIIQELKRIVNKSVILIFLLLLGINALLYISEQEQYGGEQLMQANVIAGKEVTDISDYSGIDALHNIYESYYKYYEEYMELATDEEKEEYFGKAAQRDTAEYEAGGDALDYICKRWGRVILSKQVRTDYNYTKDIQEVLDQAKRLSNIGIYKQEGTFSYYNIRKTVYDFAPMLEIKTEVTPQQPYDSLFTYTAVNYLLAVFAVIVAFRVIQEKKNGMEQLIYSAKGGREKLAAVRCVCIFVVMFIATALMYIENVILCKCIYINIGHWETSIQSNQMFAHTCLFLNRA